MALPGGRRGDRVDPVTGFITRTRGKDTNMRVGQTDSWLYGKVIKRRGKGKDRNEVYTTTEAAINRNFTPKTAKKTGAGVWKDIELPEGGNMADMPDLSKMTFEKALKQGTRADDPRNWEYYYDKYKPKKRGGQYVFAGGGKDMSPQERRSAAFRQARSRAEREARLAGEEVYATLEAEYETGRIRNQMAIDRQLAAMKKGPGQFGSTRVAKSVAAQKARAGRTAVAGQAGREQTEIDVAQVGAIGQGLPTRAAAGSGGQTVARIARQGRQRRA